MAITHDVAILVRQKHVDEASHQPGSDEAYFGVIRPLEGEGKSCRTEAR